jgi:hypothetical protein
MSKTTLIAVLLLVSVSFTPRFLAQEDHAPLPEQCIADYNLWAGAPKDDIEKMPITVLQAHEIEMRQCGWVVESFDAKHKRPYATGMLILYGTYSGHISHRALNFIQRHGLMKEFSQEDAAGQGR